MTSLCGTKPRANKVMGNADTKHTFKQAVNQLGEPGLMKAGDVAIWDQLLEDSVSSVDDIFTLLPASEIRKLRENSPSNLSALCNKIVEKITKAVESSCRTSAEQQTVANSCCLLTRLIPFIVEDADWRSFFWSNPEPDSKESGTNAPLGKSLILALCDLLFCPEFTVASEKNLSRDEVDELINLDSCEYIWDKGVGCAHSSTQSPQLHHNRVLLLHLILACFSETIYLPPDESVHMSGNRWVQLITSPENRHALPLFTSLLNTVCGYEPSGVMPYNHLIWADSKESLVETALQVLVVTLDENHDQNNGSTNNLFINYLSRIHREEDFDFILTGLTKLLMNPLAQTYLPGSQRKINFHQELLILFWKLCEHNRKFMFHVLKSSSVLDVIVPVLYYLNDARADHSRIGLMHIGVFILLLLSGERNFGVRLNKPYTATIPMDIPVFSGTHADLLIIVFHKVITTGHQRLQPLFDCFLTILCNISPYLKSISMTASCKLIYLVEAFSTPWFLLSNKTNHNLIIFLLEMLNNIIQYQFDGNSNLVYTMIRKRMIFHQLANLSTDCSPAGKSSRKKSKKALSRKNSQAEEKPMEGSSPAKAAEPGTLETSLMKFPRIDSLTEGVSAHPSQKQLDKLTQSLGSNSLESKESLSSAICSVQPGTDMHLEKKGDDDAVRPLVKRTESLSEGANWAPTPEWVESWKNKLPLQTVMRMLQVLVPQVEKMCIDKGLTDESEILRFLQNGTLVGLLPVPHPILIRRYQANPGTAMWFRTYMWGVLYLRNTEPAIWFETDIKLFQVQRL